MAKVDETLPCPNCGRPTYSEKDEPGVIYCSESESPVLVCDAVPIWKEEAQALADTEENQRRSKTSEELIESEEDEKPSRRRTKKSEESVDA